MKKLRNNLAKFFVKYAWLWPGSVACAIIFMILLVFSFFVSFSLAIIITLAVLEVIPLVIAATGFCAMYFTPNSEVSAMFEERRLYVYDQDYIRNQERALKMCNYRVKNPEKFRKEEEQRRLNIVIAVATLPPDAQGRLVRITHRRKNKKRENMKYNKAIHHEIENGREKYCLVLKEAKEAKEAEEASDDLTIAIVNDENEVDAKEEIITKHDFFLACKEECFECGHYSNIEDVMALGSKKKIDEFMLSTVSGSAFMNANLGSLTNDYLSCVKFIIKEKANEQKDSLLSEDEKHNRAYNSLLTTNYNNNIEYFLAKKCRSYDQVYALYKFITKLDISNLEIDTARSETKGDSGSVVSIDKTNLVSGSASL